MCWYPVIVNSNHIGTGEKIVLEVEKTTDLEQSHMFQGGGSVSFYSNTGEKDKAGAAVNGVIRYVRKNKMSIVLNDDELPDWINDGKLGIDLMFQFAVTFFEIKIQVESIAIVLGNNVLQAFNIQKLEFFRKRKILGQ